jgi:hypothetical protein
MRLPTAAELFIIALRQYVRIDREASPIAADVLLHLGKCAAVDLGPSVLPSGKNFAREARVYLGPAEIRYGTGAPSVEKLLRRPRRAAVKSSVPKALPQPTSSV